MTAADLRPGMTITQCPSEPGLEGWAVVVATSRAFYYGDGVHSGGQLRAVVLLTLERRWYLRKNGPGKDDYDTRTAWLRADDEVEAR